MKKAGFILAQILVVILAVGGMRVFIDNWTLGSFERFWTNPASEVRPVGYKPPDLLALQRQMLDDRFEELDTHFDGLQRAYPSSAAAESEYGLAYISFQTTNPAIGAALDRWVAQRPESAVALTGRGIYRWQLSWWKGDFTDPRDKPAGDAEWHSDAGLHEAAIRDLEQAAALDPANLQALSRLMHLTSLTGDEDAVRRIHDRVFAADPHFYSAHHFWIGWLLKAPDGLQAAEAHVASLQPEFERRPLLKRLEALILMQHAEEFAEDNRTANAIDILFDVNEDAQSAYFLTYRAKLLLDSGYRGWAGADLDQAIAYMPQMVKTLQERGQLYMATDRTELAQEDFALALALDPFNMRSLWMRANAYYAAGQYREAEAVQTAALEFRPNDPIIRFQRGQIRLDKLDDAAGAVEDLAVAAPARPDSPNVWQLYTRALAKTDDCRAVEALVQYRRACEITESDECGSSTVKAEARRVEKISERLSCPPAD